MKKLPAIDTRSTRVSNPRSLWTKDNWTESEMRFFLQKAEPIAKKSGYILSVFGSVPRNGYGRDLDVLVVVKEQKISFEDFLSKLCNILGESICDGTQDEDGANITWGQDRWIDLTFAKIS